MILLPPGAGPVLTFAAEELRRFAPWVAESATVAIGPVDWAPRAAGLGNRRGPGHPDGFLLAGDGERYAVASKTERGALYGVYAFLERLGFRWPHPGEADLTCVTEELPSLDEPVEPSYDTRGTYQVGPTTSEEIYRLIDWSARRGLNAVQVEWADGLDAAALSRAAGQRGVSLAFGPLDAVRTRGRCFKHSIGNPYGCPVNKAIFPRVAGQAVAAEPYADLGALGRPANLATVIRQDLEDYFRESYRTFYLVHNGPISWWTCPLNFDVYARTLWDLNTDPAEVLVDFAGGDDPLERRMGQAEEAAAAALCTCRPEDAAETADLLKPGSLERALHVGDYQAALAALNKMDELRRGRYGDEVVRRRLTDAASGQQPS